MLAIVNPRCTCTRVTVVALSVCVCLSVPALAASASVETSKQRYSRVFLRKTQSYSPLCKFDMARREPFPRTFRTSGLQEQELVD